MGTPVPDSPEMPTSLFLTYKVRKVTFLMLMLITGKLMWIIQVYGLNQGELTVWKHHCHLLPTSGKNQPGISAD